MSAEKRIETQTAALEHAIMLLKRHVKLLEKQSAELSDFMAEIVRPVLSDEIERITSTISGLQSLTPADQAKVNAYLEDKLGEQAEDEIKTLKAIRVQLSIIGIKDKYPQHRLSELLSGIRELHDLVRDNGDVVLTWSKNQIEIKQRDDCLESRGHLAEVLEVIGRDGL